MIQSKHSLTIKSNNMNKQEFLSKPAVNGTDAAAQILLRTQSMTSMKEIKRVVGTLQKTLYGEQVVRLPLEELSKAVEKAAYLIVD